MRPLVATLLLLATLFACTTSGAPSSDASTARSERPTQPVYVVYGPPSVALTAPLQPVGLSPAGSHAAFPGLAAHPDGTLTLAWRQGSDHVDSRDGDIVTATSTNQGETYRNPVTVRTGRDYRDPSPAYIGGELWLTYFTGSATLPAEGAYVIRGDRPAVRIDQLPYAAIAAPVVQLPDGSVGAVYYGRAPGQTRDSVWFARSTNGGTSWTSTPAPAADGQAAGREYQEPWLVVRGTTLHVLYRYGNWDSIGISSSTDGGATWTAPRPIIARATGRPTTLVYSSGTMLVIYRHADTRAAMVTTSSDGGVTWRYPRTLLVPPAGSPLGMTYAAAVEEVPGVADVVVAAEDANGDSQLYRGWLAEAIR